MIGQAISVLLLFSFGAKFPDLPIVLFVRISYVMTVSENYQSCLSSLPSQAAGRRGRKPPNIPRFEFAIDCTDCPSLVPDCSIWLPKFSLSPHFTMIHCVFGSVIPFGGKLGNGEEAASTPEGS